MQKIGTDMATALLTRFLRSMPRTFLVGGVLLIYFLHAPVASADISAVDAGAVISGVTTATNIVLTPNNTAQAGDVAIVEVSQHNSTNSVTKIADTSTGLLTFTELRYGAQTS